MHPNRKFPARNIATAKIRPRYSLYVLSMGKLTSRHFLPSAPLIDKANILLGG